MLKEGRSLSGRKSISSVCALALWGGALHIIELKEGPSMENRGE